MLRNKVPAPLLLAVLAWLVAGLAACGPGAPSGTEGRPDVTQAPSPPASPIADPTLVLETGKPGSTEPPILTLEPPQPVEP